ncbi:MAG: transcriptional regulator TetR family [Herbinix sp.]|jgi:AcrR family transcriptional regulator|nr:transcriptional regulator TetR family [Herbinix sp.]
MARRKKEAPEFHRDRIAAAAERLFTRKGIASTTMDDIASEAAYSKATLYVYYKNKEEIVGVLVLRSMKMLLERVQSTTDANLGTKEQYKLICNELTCYQAQFPLYFEIAIGEINIDFDRTDVLEVDKETYEVGELINREIMQFLIKGIREGVLRKDLSIPQTVFMFWASLSGVILMATKKRSYIERVIGSSKQDFLEYSFETLFRSIL